MSTISNNAVSNNATPIHNPSVRAPAPDVQMSSTSPSLETPLMGKLPPPVQAEIHRVLRRNFGENFSVEDFFKSFELTLEGLNKALNEKDRLLGEMNGGLQEKSQTISRQSARIFQIEQNAAALGRELSLLIQEKQAWKVEQTRQDLRIRVYDKLVQSLRKTIDEARRRIEVLDAEVKKCGTDAEKLCRLKQEKDDILNSLTKKTIFLAREAMKGKRLSFLRVLPDLRQLLGRLRFEIQSISGLLNAPDAIDASSILANNGSQASLESSHAANISSAATRAIRLSDGVVRFLDEYEYLATRVGGDVGDDTSVTQEIGRHSKGRIPPIDSLMRRARSRIAELTRREPLVCHPTVGSSSPPSPSYASDTRTPPNSSIFDSSSESGSSRPRTPLQRVVSPVNHVRITAAKMVHFGLGDSDRSHNWRDRA
ncbi:hypothetical protein PQX77_020160 [Marasmius sp. AFHP31]|nr:hypothetical protein PQX77_020160 [Marasmius sp. AFHP31]